MREIFIIIAVLLAWWTFMSVNTNIYRTQRELKVMNATLNSVALAIENNTAVIAEYLDNQPVENQ
jgi:cell division protein FtsL